MAEAIHNQTKKTFLSGVLLLSLSTVLVKIIGLLYKIPMLTYLGSEGMGYFNSAYEIYALFCVIATAGLPVALSVLIAGTIAEGRRERVREIYRTALTVFLGIGIVGSAIMVLLARQFCHMIKSEQAFGCILSIAPTVFLICISSAIRGYFQGFQRMLPTAVSQLLESLGKLFFGLLLARYALERGFDTATVAAFAGLGLTLGTAVSTLYLLVAKSVFDAKNTEKTAQKARGSLREVGAIGRHLARLAIPMTLGASLVSVTKLIDMTMILRRLQAIGMSEIAANEAYGSYTTLALSVYGLLPALVNAIALPLVPMLSAAIASGDRERQEQMVRTSYRLTALFAIPAALGVSAFARPVLTLLFGTDADAVAAAAPLLSYLGISVFLSCMITATNSVLHAYQAVNRPILSMLTGAILKTVSAYFLIGNPMIALAGAPISTFLCNAAVVFMNFYFAAPFCRVTAPQTIFWRPLLASGISVGGAYALYATLLSRVGEGTMLTLGAIGFAVLCYPIVSCLLGVFCEEDIRMLPMGDRICAWLLRLRLLKPEEESKKRNMEHVNSR